MIKFIKLKFAFFCVLNLLYRNQAKTRREKNAYVTSQFRLAKKKSLHQNDNYSANWAFWSNFTCTLLRYNSVPFFFCSASLGCSISVPGSSLRLTKCRNFRLKLWQKCSCHFCYYKFRIDKHLPHKNESSGELAYKDSI